MLRLGVVAVAAICIILFVAFIISRLVNSLSRGMSVRMQVFLALAAIVGTFAFGLGLMVVDRIDARAVRFATQSAEDEAKLVAGMLEGDMLRMGIGLEEVVARLELERVRGADLRMEIIGNGGELLFPVEGNTRFAEAGMVHVDVPLKLSGEQVGSVRIVKPTIVMQRMLADFAPTVLVISLVLGAAAAVAAVWIGHAIARPIVSLTEFSERVSAGERTATPPPAFGREVTKLTRSIDSMRRQLEGRPFVETFAADLSHELKNPVAAIRASAEVLDEEGALEDLEAARGFVKRIRESTARIEKLLSDLLDLAQIEARGIEDFDVLDLRDLVRSAVKALDEAGRVQVEAKSDARVRGDALWLGRAVGNLVENALVHSPAGSPVRISLSRAGDEVQLSIYNEGAVPQRLVKRVFARFITTRQDKGGTGLGLGIARAVAEAHSGKVELASAGPPEIEFRLRLPHAGLREMAGQVSERIRRG